MRTGRRFSVWVVLSAALGACAHAVEPNDEALGIISGNQPAIGGASNSPAPSSSNTGAGGAMASFGTGGTLGSGGVSAAFGGAASLGGMGGAPSGLGGAATVSLGGNAPAGGATTSLGGGPSVDDAFACDSQAVPVSSLKLQVKSNGLEPSRGQISVVFNLIHTGAAATTIALRQTSVRYWFTADGVSNLVADCDYARVGCANVRARFVTASLGQADTYLEVSFTSGALSVAPGGDSGEVQLRIHNMSYQGTFNQANDYSFTGLTSAFADHSLATAYHQCALVWGTEPPSN